MDINYSIETDYSRDVLLALLSDPEFVVRTFLPVKEIKKEDENFYSITLPGTLRDIKLTARYINNGETITLIVNLVRPKGVGKMIIKPEDRRIDVKGTSSIITDPVLAFAMNRNFNKLKKEINEIFRLERIKRKI